MIKHIVLIPQATHTEWRTSDGRSGSEPALDYAPAAMWRALRRLGAYSDAGFSPVWTFEVLRPDEEAST